VLGALQEAERDLCIRLQSTSIGEDDAADMSNDLGFIRAVKRDLDRQLGAPRQKSNK
jgi:hypothetical protein